MNFELTKKEKKILESLSTERRVFFDEKFGKVTKRMWATGLKHYDNTYKIDDAICICEAFDWKPNASSVLI